MYFRIYFYHLHRCDKEFAASDIFPSYVYYNLHFFLHLSVIRIIECHAIEYYIIQVETKIFLSQNGLVTTTKTRKNILKKGQ